MTTRVLAVVLAVSAGACLAQEADEKAFDRMIEHYKHLNGCVVSLSLEVHGGGEMMEAMLASMNQSSPGYALKPNRFAFWNEEGANSDAGEAPPTVYCDGTQITSALEALSVYTVEDAPASFAEVLSGADPEAVTGWQMIPGSQFLFALLSDDPRAGLETQLTNISYKGVQGEGEAAYHVYTTTEAGAEGEGGTLEMRIAASGEPWLLAFKPDLTNSGAPEGLELLLSFAGWTAISEAPPEGVITPKPEWTKVEDLGQAIEESMRQGEEMEIETEEPGSPGDGG